MSKKSKKYKKKSSFMLKFSMIVFGTLAIFASYIILNKGYVAGFSLVKIEAPVELNQKEPVIQEPKKDTIEITAEKKYLSYKNKEKTELTVLRNGEEVDLQEVEFTSSDEEVIAVKNGMATAVSVGKATITAKIDDLEATLDLRVIIPITSISFTTTNSTIRVGRELQMKLIAKPSDANIETLKYESSDEEVATVNSNGIVKGISPGKVTITVTDTYSEITKSVNLTIRK